eukprot:CAMPEP_0183499670 /NCGR_PEP_ID=MMETSP0371-20130417/1880_1 /TAXON_ID=268820 /ORGANISM="Peridinium aciculiferum, Strain PAER-2" /LENGTH=44 /DNA_ID= /DNA_START= /DNA_END= /DNA_ORIENTATION=
MAAPLWCRVRRRRNGGVRVREQKQKHGSLEVAQSCSSQCVLIVT